MTPLLANYLGGFELVLILAIVLLMLGGRKLPELSEGLRKGLDEFKKSSRDLITESEDHHRESEQGDDALSSKEAGILVIASGFGIGQAPFAPGTFGSLFGVLWFGLLVAPGSVWFYALGIIAGFFVSVWACGEAEKILKQKDPSFVVIDEIIAIPICFTSWVLLAWFKQGQFPEPEYFFSSQNWPWVVAVFAVFRFFDIAKPWPVFQSQSLPGGWGVTVDDVLAALYVNMLTLLAYLLMPTAFVQ